MRPPGADGVDEDPDGYDVYAAGGIVADDEGRILVVHRPRYDDWSLPKGKLDPGETMPQCAQREVAEETGLRCVLGDEAGSVSYLDRNRRRKLVRYWHMTVLDGAFSPNDEVDAVRWVSVAEALTLLTYPRDATVLRAR